MDKTEILKEFCLRITQEHFADEAFVFPHVWDTFWTLYDCKRVEDLDSGLFQPFEERPITELGAIGHQETQILDVLYAIAGVCGASARLIERSEAGEITEEDVLKSISVIGKRMNIPGYVHHRISEFAALLAGILNGNVNTIEEQPSLQEEESVHCEWLLDGKCGHSEGMIRRYQGEKAILVRDYDIVIDQPYDALKILIDGEYEESKLSEFPPRLAAMLWIAIFNIGKRVDFEQIGRLMEFTERELESQILDGRLNQYSKRMAKESSGKVRLGAGLRDRIYGKRTRRFFQIARVGWSFYWIRDSKDSPPFAIF